MKKIWGQYKYFLEKQYLGNWKNQAKDINFWRSRLFMKFMLFVLPIGIIVYIPSMIMSIIGDLPIVAIIDTIALLAVFILVFNQKLKLNHKKYILIACFYVLSIVLLIFLGLMGPGLIYLFGTSIFMVLVISSKAGYISVGINMVIYGLLIIGSLLPNINIAFFEDYTFGTWLTVGANFILINIVVVVSIAALINGLQKTVLSEKALRNKLIEESEKLKIAKDKAVESDKLKSAFLANMSHEIRTPLNAIVGFANIMQKGKNPDNQQTYIDIINKSSEQLLTLIDDIINLSKIEAGAIELNPQKIKLANFVKSVVELMKSECPEHLEFKFQYNPAHKDEELCIDIQKVTQVITNLITNAFKYTEKGFVEFGTSLSINKKTIHFYVKDTGIGIADDKRFRVFDRFYQENDINSGVGLGLSISKSLVKAMNGEIHLDSKLGRGTTFFVNLPNSHFAGYRFDNQPGNGIKPAKTQDKKLKILIAEDIESNFAILKEILDENEHTITRAINGNEAVSYVKSEYFDIVLMDLKMPLMDGFEAASQIRQFNKTLPIIAVTAYAFDSDEEKALLAGCNEYLSKPVDFKKLHQLINKHLN